MSEFKPKVEIITERSERGAHSLWYFNKDIAKVEIPNGKKLYLEGCGELEVYFEPDGNKYVGENAVDRAIELGYTDDDLTKVYEHDGFILDNWLALVEVDANGEYLDDYAIYTSYDEAMENIEQAAIEFYKTQYS